MTKEELFFKENYPEYVTEKGECLSPYWDLFSAGVICATFELNNKIAELKKEIKENEDLATVAYLQGASKYKDKADLKDEELNCMITDFNTYKSKAKEIIKYLLGFIKQEGYRTRWDINIEQAEQFLKECE